MLRRHATQGAFVLAIAGLLASAAHASPLGTSYTASVVNLPGSASATLAFDGLESPLGGSGLKVREKTTSFGTYQLIEFSLKTADGEGFVGQQGDPMAPASVAVSNLECALDAEDPTAAKAEADSGFLWLSIDGEAQALSDSAGLGLRFGTHPFDPSIPVVYIDNDSTTELGFDTAGRTTFEAFAALVGPIAAVQVDGIHLAVAAAPVPEPRGASVLAAGLIGIWNMARRRTHRTSQSPRGAGAITARPAAPMSVWLGRGIRNLLLVSTAAGWLSIACRDTGNTSVHQIGQGGTSQTCYTGSGELLEVCPVTIDPQNGDVVLCLDAFPPESFVRWEGSDCNCGDPDLPEVLCNGPTQCELAANPSSGEFRSCTAIFCSDSTLEVDLIGPGTVTSNPSRLDCNGNQCLGSFCNGADAINPTEVVTVTPTPRPGSGAMFDGWTGDPDCVDDDGVVGVVTLSTSVNCTAHFRQPEIFVAVTGAGRVTFAGVSCRQGSPSEECEASVPLGPETQLVAHADPGAQFLGWSGDCEGSTTSLTFPVTGDRDCTATFGAVPLAGGRGTFEVVSIADDESLGTDQIVENSSFFGFGNGWLQGSGDLAIVSFISNASNLTPPPSGAGRTYLRDRRLGSTREIRSPPGSISSLERMGLSADGRYAAYARRIAQPPPQNFLDELVRRDLAAVGESLIVVDDPSTGIESDPVEGTLFWRLSGNARFVLYQALAPSERGNLLSTRDPNLIIHDSCLGTLPVDACTPHSVALAYDAAGGLLPVNGALSLDDPPDISRDGRFVLFRAFTSAAFEATDLFLLDRDTDDDGRFDEPNAVAIGSALPGTDGQGICDGHTALDASGRYVLFTSADPNLPGNGGPPSFCRALRRDTCAGTTGPCTPTYEPLTVPEVTASTVYTSSTRPIDFGASGRYVAFLTNDPLFFRIDPSELTNPVRVVRDTCLGMPVDDCTPDNLVILGADGGPIEDFLLDLRLADDGSLAILEGRRGAALPGAPNPGFQEVLLAGTGFEPDPGVKPTVNGTLPTSAPTGSEELLVSVIGEDFVPGATLRVGLGGEARTTIFVSREKLQAWLIPADRSNAGPLRLKVENPGGSSSDEFTFTVTAGP